MRIAPLAPVILCALLVREVDAVEPLDNTQEFMHGELAKHANPPVGKAVPDRLKALPRDQSALPKGVWLRFQIFGSGQYKAWSVQLQIDDTGRIFQVSHLGDSTAAKVKAPAWPTTPTQALGAALDRVRKAWESVPSTAPLYCGYEGETYAPVFVVTVRIGGVQREFFFEAFENEAIKHLRRIAYFAYATPLGNSKKARRRGR